MVTGEKETLKRTKSSILSQLHINHLICTYKCMPKINAELLDFQVVDWSRPDRTIYRESSKRSSSTVQTSFKT